MKATDTKVLDFIRSMNRVYAIPPFQRNYEWTELQCEELFNDILSTLENHNSHYLGNITYYIGENTSAAFQEFILIDGQQRITSILILLCALRDSMDDEEMIDVIESQFLKNKSKDERYRLRLKQTAYDSKYFADIINKTANLKSENNVIKNYNYFIEAIKNEKNTNGIPPEAIFNSLDNLQMVDVNLQITDLYQVQVIFEKINSTGKQLTASDLIRNYLLIANNIAEQERLYENYWNEIETKIKTENIPRFVHDYLVMKKFDDVIEKETYDDFKSYVAENSLTREEVLQNMKRYSEFYAYLKFENSSDKKINAVIHILKYLKTDDVFPLYLYLLEKLFENDKKLLHKILTLLKDFLLRYRIVAPSSGGGTLRSVIQKIIEKIESKEISLSYEDIYFELSNSSSLSGRFPDDEEFSQALCESNEKNYKYARAIYVAIENYVTQGKNLEVDFDAITIEHLMPQTLSPRWKSDLGGDEKALETYENHLNSIGNLTPLSQKLNSSLSNNSWKEKLKQIDFSGFYISKDLKNQSAWTKKQIENRDFKIAELACKAVTPPLERTRKAKSSLDDFAEGEYPASDITTKMEYANLDYILIDGKKIQVSTWRGYFSELCTFLSKDNPALFEKIVGEKSIHKSTSKKSGSNIKDPVITENKNLLANSVQIKGTKYFCEGCLSSQAARRFAKQLLDSFEMTDKVSIYVSTKTREQE